MIVMNSELMKHGSYFVKQNYQYIFVKDKTINMSIPQQSTITFVKIK